MKVCICFRCIVTSNTSRLHH